jgi:hypothetical protein
MQYAILLYVPGDIEAEPGSAEWMASLPGHKQFAENATDQGLEFMGKALHAARGATTLRVRDGERLLTDGPFAETKEQLWGFHLVEADDIDTVIELSAGLWEAENGSVEIRPVVAVPRPVEAVPRMA